MPATNDQLAEAKALVSQTLQLYQHLWQDFYQKFIFIVYLATAYAERLRCCDVILVWASKPKVRVRDK